VILIDCRETKATDKIYKYISGIVGEQNCRKEQLKIGDIVSEGKNICIERKSINDFYSSITNQRIFEQAKQMCENYDNNYVLISGAFKQLLTDPNIFYAKSSVFLGAIASLCEKYKIIVITVENDKQLCYLACKLIEKSGELVDYNPCRQLATTESCRISALTAVRGISVKKATALYNKFGSISAICAADVESLCVVNGIGAKLADDIKEVF